MYMYISKYIDKEMIPLQEQVHNHPLPFNPSLVAPIKVISNSAMSSQTISAYQQDC